MRNRVLFNSPRVQLPLVLSMMIVLILSLAGCGGGGGGGTSSGNGNTGGNTGGTGNNTGGQTNPNLATISGFVKDNTPSHNPVQGALVTVIVPGGTNRTATTAADGSFTVTNVALNATTFKVASPNPVAYYNYANFNGNLYDLNACTLPLPVLKAGANTLTEIDMYLGGTNPPPPPPVGGCPA